MNPTLLTTSDSNKGVGRKGCKPPTARRKGGRNTTKAPPSVVVDRVTCASTSGTATLSPSTITNPQCLRPQLVATNPPYLNPSFVRSGFQYSYPLGSTPASMVHTTPYSGPSHSSSSQSSFRIILLQLCSPLVRLCYGCSQALKPGGIIASPPHDLVIMTRMNRQFIEKILPEK